MATDSLMPLNLYNMVIHLLMKEKRTSVKILHLTLISACNSSPLLHMF